MEQCQELTQKIAELTGFTPLQVVIHRDEVSENAKKGVDMKIGLDIATLANKHHAEKIILITADSDFIPAVKHARKEGIIVQLDPMRIPETQIKKGLLEHIDILSSVFINKNKNGN
ncbi:NYN domain-containing protein [Campylobacter jejuni]|nr:NYN domain-containing protein [Campylobacter jejuni]QDQ35326.1 NYN domain-containing protein [Campylobacter jejuni]